MATIREKRRGVWEIRATTAITSGHDVRTVAGRLGHANAAMTLRVYAHVVQAADEALAVGLGDALNGDG